MTTQALLNFNGADGSQVFTDETGNQTWTVLEGTPAIEVDDFKFGVSSLFIPPASSIQTTLLNSLTGDFNIEMWVNPTAGYTTVDRNLINFPDINCHLKINGSLNFVRFVDDDTGALTTVAVTVFGGIWTHINFSRKDGLIRITVNGMYHSEVMEWTKSIGVLQLGQAHYSDYYLNGYVDDLRIIDESIYNSGFIKPNSELTTSYTVNLTDVLLTDLMIITAKRYLVPYIGDGEHAVLTCGGVTGEVVEPDPDPTSTNIISGNVSKLGLPYELKVVAVTVELNPEVVGQTTSDPITGDYSMDVWPWEGDTLVYAAPDYGSLFNPNAFLGAGQILHPTVPNKLVYVAQNDGFLAAEEPVWPESGFISSNEVSLLAVPLYRPLINGFIKPTVTPI